MYRFQNKPRSKSWDPINPVKLAKHSYGTIRRLKMAKTNLIRSMDSGFHAVDSGYQVLDSIFHTTVDSGFRKGWIPVYSFWWNAHHLISFPGMNSLRGFYCITRPCKYTTTSLCVCVCFFYGNGDYYAKNDVRKKYATIPWGMNLLFAVNW